MQRMAFVVFGLSLAGCGLFPHVGSSGTTNNSNGSGSGSTAGGSAGDGNNDASGSGGAQVRFVGRFDTSQAAGPMMGWPGSAVLTSFEGSSLTVQLQELRNDTYESNAVNSMYQVTVDGGTPYVFSLQHGQTDYPVPGSFGQKTHTVRLVKRTESQIGVDQFLGFSTDGQLLSAPAAAARRIEFVGDSITAGYGDDGDVAAGSSNSCSFTPATENVEDTYAAKTAAAFNAEYVDIAFAGKGMYRNVDPQSDPTNTMPVLYKLTLADQYNDDWDFSQWTPQAVVINLGTNDFTAPGTLNTAAFTATYVKFLATVRQNYPQAAIFCVQGPMLSGTDLTQARAAIEAAVQESRDSNTFYVEVAQDSGQNGYGCEGHPNAATHQLMAQTLESAFTAKLGWNP